jgi:hypothetical protein
MPELAEHDGKIVQFFLRTILQHAYIMTSMNQNKGENAIFKNMFHGKKYCQKLK